MKNLTFVTLFGSAWTNRFYVLPTQDNVLCYTFVLKVKLLNFQIQIYQLQCDLEGVCLVDPWNMTWVSRVRKSREVRGNYKYFQQEFVRRALSSSGDLDP